MGAVTTGRWSGVVNPLLTGNLVVAVSALGTGSGRIGAVFVSTVAWALLDVGMDLFFFLFFFLTCGLGQSCDFDCPPTPRPRDFDLLGPGVTVSVLGVGCDVSGLLSLPPSPGRLHSSSPTPPPVSASPLTFSSLLK